MDGGQVSFPSEIICPLDKKQRKENRTAASWQEMDITDT